MKYYKILKNKIYAKLSEIPKTASHQEPLQNRSTSALCAHTLHTCSSQKRFPTMFFEMTPMSRESVQSIMFWHRRIDFRWGFAIGFESITKP